ncbi:hypothetical protein FOYG_03810 [Fusarium oxysporum NRRL 32931]|uniref:6-methylsalicylate decarboxylase n=1 Tax=Fusarium oxysporum NRRL 32931 TaxID=660029 RepID=W9J506_FUSOX|nr:hypothetical protein FOYG_03810 [Fusarium oxysporum NRRL 32931]
MSNIPRIDVHYHIIPPQLEGVGAGLKGIKVPSWSVQSDRAFNQTHSITSAIYAVSTPGVTHIADPEESTRVARAMNEYTASLRDANPMNGFFATADGVTLFTSYATPQGYLGHPEYVPIWEELNRRKAVIFVHPINNIAAVYFDDRLPMPAFDWPHETGRTAMDMILNRRLEQFPGVKIILSHAGGTLAALVQRATMIALPEFGDIMSAEDIVKQAKQFYFDAALSGSQEVFPMILSFAKPGHLLFGSDFPHAPEKQGLY